MRLTVADIVRATDGELVQRGAAASVSGASSDSRKMGGAELFVAIAGPHYDGHAFCQAAIAGGARALLVSASVAVDPPTTVIRVGDTITSLGDLAAAWRSRFPIPCVAITGSNGKSTTKEMAAKVLEGLGPILKTEGNFNNLIGLPQMLLGLDASHRAMVLELGMNAPGEIRRLSTICRPDVGVITNVTAAHLEHLGTVEAVARAKGELFEVMGDAGVAIVNEEDPHIRRLVEGRRGKMLRFGMRNSCDVQFGHMETEDLQSMTLVVRAGTEEAAVELALPGAHNVMNALAALACGIALGVPLKEGAKRLEGFVPMPMRFERIQLANGVRLVNDSYNANPGSMKAAFRTVGSALRAGRFVAVLGSMLELGNQSEALHEEIGRAAVELGVKRLFAFGAHAASFARGARSAGLHNGSVTTFENMDALKTAVVEELQPGDVVLVKGSRGVKMERVVEHLKQRIGSD